MSWLAWMVCGAADTNLPKKKPTKRGEEATPKENRPPRVGLFCAMAYGQGD